MDKFNRRPSWRDHIRRLRSWMIIFAAVAAVFIALPIFGPRVPYGTMRGMLFGYLWFFGVCSGVIGVGVALRAAYNGGLIKVRWLRPPIALQPIQGPGFTAFELAAIDALLSTFSIIAEDLRRFWTQAEVCARTNTGWGCITQLMINGSVSPEIRTASIASMSSLWRVSGLSDPVSCTFWLTDTGDELIEFATGGDSSAHIDWASATFDLLDGCILSESDRLPPIIRNAPLMSLSR